jgi:dihydropteroate synthase
MGILNVTPDSFFDGGRFQTLQSQVDHVEKMVADGADIIDIGAVSTRPGAPEIEENEELARLIPVIQQVRHSFPGIVISVDTFRSNVARIAAGNGADIINDIYAGRFDPLMLETVAGLKLPYIMMHMKGTPATMQINPEYSDVVAEVYYFFEHKIQKCRDLGLTKIIVDPGFGFGKRVEDNYQLLAGLDRFRTLEAPILAGLSRKSMIRTVLEVTAAEALNGTTALHAFALMKGADIIRVHDVKEAVQVVKLFSMIAN